MQYTLDDQEIEAITHAVQAAYSHPHGDCLPLDRALLCSHHDRDWPLWLALCHAVIVKGQFHAAGAWQPLVEQLASETELSFQSDFDEALQDFVEPAAWHPLTPARIAGLAAGLAFPLGRHAVVPDCLQDDLVVRLFQGQWPPQEKLDLTQLLVSGWRGADDSGRLARLELWLVPADSLDRAADHGALVRAPGAALLPVDFDFAEGLNRVQRLLRQVLEPGAPALAWSLRPLPQTDLAAPPPLPAVTGPSATAALAYGALVLLRDHLKPEHAALADWLHDTEPATITITAALDGPLPDEQPFRWPRFIALGCEE